MTKFNCNISLLLILPFQIGCFFGGSGEVAGTVLIDNQPTGGFEITFISTTDNDLMSRGVVEKDGSFRLSMGRGKYQIPVGEYRVTLVPVAIGDEEPAPKRTFSETYMHVDQSDLVQIVHSGENDLKIEIQTVQ